MNILMLAPLPPPTGGIASWTVRYKDYCESNGISLKIINTAMQGERAISEVMTKSLKVELHRTCGIVRNLKREIKSYKYDIVHLNTSCSQLGVIRDALCVFAIHNKIPIVLHCRCNIEDQLRTNSISQKAFRYLVKKSSKVIVLNKFSKEYVDRIEKRKAVFIPNFINEKTIERNRSIHSSIKNVIFVGHVERAKGIIQIVEAAKFLPDISFTLVGAIRENISDIVIPSNVSVVGCVSAEKVQNYLKQADVFLFPSLSEGFSNAMLEAMSTGLPIVASDVGANSEMIEDKGGIILRENTGRAIYKAILEMNDIKKRSAMSLWNKWKIQNSYAIDLVMKQYFSLYEQINKS